MKTSASGNVFRPFFGARLSPRRLKYKLRRKAIRDNRWHLPYRDVLLNGKPAQARGEGLDSETK